MYIIHFFFLIVDPGDLHDINKSQINRYERGPNNL